MSGLYCLSSLPATAGSLPSAASICSRFSLAVSSLSGLGSRATATTDAPSARKASVTPLPSPRLAPTTIARLSASRLIPHLLSSRKTPVGQVEANESAEIGYAHLTLMARTAQSVQGSSTAAPFEEGGLLDKAREYSVGRLWYFCHHMRHATDPEKFTAEQSRATEARTLKMSTYEDGSLALEGWFDSVGGAVVRSALEPLAQPQGDHDERGREHRNADAFVEVCSHVQDIGVLPQRPHLQITASLDTLRAVAGSPAGDMEYSLPVSAATVRRLACDGTITRVVLAPESVVIDVGRARRVVAGAARRALNARDGHCKWPRCERPASWSNAHHIVHWTDGGETDLANMILLCHRHHWMAHEGGWQLVRTDEGEVLT